MPIKQDAVFTGVFVHDENYYSLHSSVPTSHPYYHNQNRGEDSCRGWIPASRGNHSGFLQLPVVLFSPHYQASPLPSFPPDCCRRQRLHRPLDLQFVPGCGRAGECRCMFSLVLLKHREFRMAVILLILPFFEGSVSLLHGGLQSLLCHIFHRLQYHPLCIQNSKSFRLSQLDS